jgi:hypothetical protein
MKKSLKTIYLFSQYFRIQEEAVKDSTKLWTKKGKHFLVGSNNHLTTSNG